MPDNRERFLNNIKSKLGDMVLPGLSPEHPGSFQGYSFDPEADMETLITSFTHELEALSGHVYRVNDLEEVVPIILKILQSHEAQQIIAWDEPLPEAPWLTGALREAGIETRDNRLARDGAGRQATLAANEAVRVGLTGATGGLADTGAIGLVSGVGRGRLASLLPPVHVALLSAKNLYPSLPSFLADNPSATRDGSNLVFIAGPSRTGDIEMTLSMGVHGPGEVHVIITP